MFRFLGTTPQSSTVVSTLNSICDQLAKVYDVPEYETPSSWNDTIRMFTDFLEMSNKERPLVIILDSLDQLTFSEGRRTLSWLPRKVPEFTHILLSSLPEKSIIGNLQLRTEPQNFIEVPTLSSETAVRIVEMNLENVGRTVTPEQKNIIERSLNVCSLPLFVQLTSEEALLWRSYNDASITKLSCTVEEMTDGLFGRLEQNHGEVLVRHSLAYITASGNGLSQVELEDLLSLDDTVLDDVFQYHVSPIRRIPQLLWIRIEHDISSYLVQRMADNTTVTYWYHRQFIEAARRRFLADSEFEKTIHSNMVAYYSGTWHGRPKPFRFTAAQQRKLKLSTPDASADRLVAAQPLVFQEDPDFRKSRLNYRKLSQLTQHMRNAGQVEDLKALLFTYDFLLSKMCALSPQAVHDDLDIFEFAEDEECCLLKHCIRIAKQSLQPDPRMLSVEITGSLLPYTTWLPYPSLEKLIDEAYYKGVRHNSLLVKSQMYAAVDGALRYIIDHPELPQTYQNRLHVWKDTVVVLLANNRLLLVNITTGDVEKEVQLPNYGKPVKYNVLYPGIPSSFVIIGDASQRDTNAIVVYDITTDDVTVSINLQKVYKSLGFYENYQISYDHGKGRIIVNSVNREADVFDTDGKIVYSFPETLSCLLTKSDPPSDFIITHTKGAQELQVYDLQFNKICDVQLTGIPSKIILSPNGEKAITMYDKSNKLNIVDLTTLDEKHASVRPIAATSINDMLKGLGPRNVTDISVSRDSSWLLIHVPNKVMLFSMSRLQLQKEFSIEADKEVSDYEVLKFTSALSEDNKALIVGYGRRLIYYSVAIGTMVHQLNVDTSALVHMYLSQNLLLTATEKGRLLKIWDLGKMNRGRYILMI